MTMAPLVLMEQSIPTWMKRYEVAAASLIGEATVSAPGAARDWRILVAVSERAGVIEVREKHPGQLLPMFCPQRHVNDNHTFCLGYGAGKDISDRNHAVVWWGLLYRFLELQRIAGRTRRWPPRQSLSHGQAGLQQIRAQAAADRLGILDQYMDMLDGGSHWLANRYLVLNKNGDGLINGRAACPVGCVRSRGKPRLRRECCRKADLIELVQHERQREMEERAYWRDLQKRNVTCCNTMELCPLRRPN